MSNFLVFRNFAMRGLILDYIIVGKLYLRPQLKLKFLKIFVFLFSTLR